MRAYAATFVGAFLIALIYSTKSEDGPLITIARSGDTALVLDKSTSPAATAPASGFPSIPAIKAADSVVAPDPQAAPLAMGTTPLPSSGTSSPPVVPADLDALRAQGPVVPVAGLTAKNLIDSFDDKRGGTRTHNALDIMAARNTPVLAATSGTIVKLHNSAAGGLTIYQSDPTSRFVIMYGHLDSFKPGLKEGMAVKRGELIGFVGSTGNANPAGPHLHLQITRNDNMNQWWRGTPINPFLVFRPKG